MLKFMILAAGVAAALPTATAAQQQPASQPPKPVTRAQFNATLDQQFNAVDTNHDGVISAAEIQAEQARELERIRAAVQARLREAFNRLDTNKDGQLSFAEFAAQAPGVNANETPQQLIQKLDTNHDGKISPAEFKAPRLQEFDKADLNHDGVVTPAEAAAYARAHPQQ